MERARRHRPVTDRNHIVYLALGDSYTIGTGASHESRNFPSLLAASLQEASRREVEVVNPAVNGFTTIDLLAKELGYITDLKPDLVSVLIGVNDLVQGRSAQQYRESLVEIYDAIAATQLPAGRVAAISIPNWSVAPAARDYGDSRSATLHVGRPHRGQHARDGLNRLDRGRRAASRRRPVRSVGGRDLVARTRGLEFCLDLYPLERFGVLIPALLADVAVALAHPLVDVPFLPRLRDLTLVLLQRRELQLEGLADVDEVITERPVRDPHLIDDVRLVALFEQAAKRARVA
ncbi:MAG: SGNH/GDSL hydrolase family protein [Chloroflexi bacterium]|nr:MAG: SGNH/GDSL hydrolase family protein [Chloroflexota bacterium]